MDGTYSKQKGKYVNDAAPKSKQNNSVMKILEVDGVPHLVQYASRKICKGEEIRYDYGEKNLPWRKKVCIFISFHQRILQDLRGAYIIPSAFASTNG